MKTICYVCLFSVWTFCESTFAQDNKIVIGETVIVHSTVLNEDRAIEIYLPQGYAQGKAKYPVAYLLDGHDHFIHASGILGFITQQGVAPQMIMIGVSNAVNRTRDLTPKADTADARFPHAGGADNFLKFLSDELVPYVNKTYRTEPYKILIGHSFGGLFAVHTLLNKPDTFDAYIAISPALWWNGQADVLSAEGFFKTHPSIKKFLYVSLGTEGDQMSNPIAKFTKTLEKSAPKNFVWKYASMPVENHGTTPHRTIYDALEWMYTGWNYQQADSGIAGLEKHFEGLSEKFGYKIAPGEFAVNQLGYTLLALKKISEAIKAFQFNVKNYPESANVYDSLADGLEANNELELARTHCMKAVELGTKTADPNLPAFQQHLQNLKNKMGLK